MSLLEHYRIDLSNENDYHLGMRANKKSKNINKSLAYLLIASLIPCLSIAETVKKNKLDDSENSVMSRLLIRNIEAIKRLAEKENIKIEKLIKHLKQGE